MSDYMTAYMARKKNTDIKLRAFAKECISAGYEVYVSNMCELIETLYVFKDDLHCKVGFREVPYRWICGNDISTIDAGLMYPDTYKFPFTIDDVADKLGTIQNTPHIKGTKESFLKWYSFIIPFKQDNDED